MEELISYALVVAGVGVMWWQHARRGRPEFESLQLDEDVDVVLHLARHLAQSRNQALASVHVLYALIQESAIGETIAACGGNVATIETELFEAMEKLPPDDTPAKALTCTLEAARVYTGAVSAAGSQKEASATSTHLWASLVRNDPATAKRVEVGGVSAVQILFSLVHGRPEPQTQTQTTSEPEIAAVLINDDYSTVELVVELLSDVFGFDEETARRYMLKAHNTGQAFIGLFPSADALNRIAAANSRARSQGYPLWIRPEQSARYC